MTYISDRVFADVSVEGMEKALLSFCPWDAWALKANDRAFFSIENLQGEVSKEYTDWVVTLRFAVGYTRKRYFQIRGRREWHGGPLVFDGRLCEVYLKTRKVVVYE